MFARRADGSLVTRDCTCKCGKEYTQYMVSKRYVEILKAHGNSYAIFVSLAPKGFLPLFCISCERVALQSEGRVQEKREQEELKHKWESLSL